MEDNYCRMRYRAARGSASCRTSAPRATSRLDQQRRGGGGGATTTERCEARRPSGRRDPQRPLLVRVAVISTCARTPAAFGCCRGDARGHRLLRGRRRNLVLGDVPATARGRPRSASRSSASAPAISLAGDRDLVVCGYARRAVDPRRRRGRRGRLLGREHLPRRGALVDCVRSSPRQAQRASTRGNGSVRNQVWEYVLPAEDAVSYLDCKHTNIALVGRSHVALAVHLGSSRAG